MLELVVLQAQTLKSIAYALSVTQFLDFFSPYAAGHFVVFIPCDLAGWAKHDYIADSNFCTSNYSTPG